MRVGEYTSKYVREYLTSDWWEKLKKKNIYSNKRASCWICTKKYNLLLHHENYKNLGNEKLNKDIFILCFQCHTQVHFQKVLYFFKIRTPLIEKKLRRRRYLLRLRYCIHNKNIGLSILFLIKYIINK